MTEVSCWVVLIIQIQNVHMHIKIIITTLHTIINIKRVFGSETICDGDHGRVDKSLEIICDGFIYGIELLLWLAGIIGFNGVVGFKIGELVSLF